MSLSKSYLQDKTQRVFMNGNYSNGVVKRGVPQGSLVRPLLFNISINDIPLHITTTKVVCDPFADVNLVHSFGKDVKLVQHCFRKA